MDNLGVEKQKVEKSADQKKASALSLAFELGYLIAVPIVVLALIGRFADKTLETSPLFLLVGIFVALAISTSLIYRKITRLS